MIMTFWNVDITRVNFSTLWIVIGTISSQVTQRVKWFYLIFSCRASTAVSENGQGNSSQGSDYNSARYLPGCVQPEGQSEDQR